jgi:hypothetical protein
MDASDLLKSGGQSGGNGGNGIQAVSNVDPSTVNTVEISRDVCAIVGVCIAIFIVLSFPFP